MKPLAIVVCLVAIVCVGCGESGSPAGPSSARPDDTSIANASGPSGAVAAATAIVPFKGHLQGRADPPVFDPPPSPFFSAHLRAEGQATHLGRFIMDFSHRVNLVTLAGSGKAVFTAANGDTLMTDVEGTATPAGSPTAFTVTETHTVTGGTGRFTNATGQFTITRAVDFADPFTSGQMKGWISTPGD